MKTDLVLTRDEYVNECCVPPRRVSPPAGNARHVAIKIQNNVDPEPATAGCRCDRWGHPCPDCHKHKTEPLSLAAVASAAGASVFHFCKVFRKSTGLRFTDYVTRVRLEEARTQLLNPGRRISEVAYDVGFQSLTQFNRTFKRVFGQSPSEFRTNLSSNKRAGKAA